MLLDALDQELIPIRTKAEALRREPDRVRDALRDGAARARASAASTMAEVREAMGLTAKVLAKT
jgi:tryptophanyl-tRNA synthetase